MIIITPLTTAEEKLMLLLWKLETFYMKDVMAGHPEPKPHQNTVSTYLKILQEKGYLSVTKEGRIFRYSAAIPYDEYRKFLLKNFIEQFCNNSGAELLALLKEEKWTKDEGIKQTERTPKKKSPKKKEFKIAETVLNPKIKIKKKKKKKK